MGWDIDGNPVCTMPTPQGPFVCAIRIFQPIGQSVRMLDVVWEDRRSPGATGSDLYVGTISLSDARPVDGDVLCDAVNDQIAPAATAVAPIEPFPSQYYGEHLIVAWEDHRDPGLTLTDIYARRRGGPEWGLNGIAVCAEPGEQTKPAILRCGQGAIVAWTDARLDDGDIYAQRLAGGGQAKWAANGIPVCNASEAQDNVALARFDPNDSTAYVAWRDARFGAEGIYVTRLFANGATAPGWPANGLRVTPDLAVPRLVADPSGDLYVLWDHDRGGGEHEPRVIRVDLSGSIEAGWPTAGVSLCDAPGDRMLADAVRGPGGVYGCWSESRLGSFSSADIYLQRVTATGAIAPGWPSDGRVVCGALADQTEPTAVEQSDGAVVVGWRDDRGFDSDVYAIRLLASGALAKGWVADGTRLTGAFGDQRAPRMVDHEVSNGARAVWLDERDLFSDVDIYGQIVTERGVVDVPPIAAPGSPLQLGRPHPTPARDVVSLSLSCASEGPANIAIFDGAGRVVRSLPSLPCGATRSVSWDGRDADGRIVPAGIYFVRAKAGSEMAARAVVLVR